MQAVNRRRTTLAIWIAFLLCAVGIVIWPLVSGMIVMNDDIKFLRSPACESPTLDELALAWRSSPSFRPMEILVARLCDPVTLACPWVVPVQAAGFAMLAWAVVRLCAIVMPAEPALAPLVLLFVAVSPATTCSVWQMDACSQTWSAALGLWACAFAWQAGEAAARGESPWPGALRLFTVFVPLVLVKETAYGWSLGIGSCQIAGALMALRRDRGAALRMLVPTLPTVIFPAAFLAVRLALGAVGRSLEGDDGSRYQVELGVNTVVNLALSIGAAFATGPYYVMGNEQAFMAFRALPLVAGLMVGLPLALAVEGVLFGGRTLERPALTRAAVLSVAATGSVVVTCLTQSVSELYGLGLNAAFGVLLGTAVLGARQAQLGRWTRVGVNASMTAALLIGLVGTLGRAHHFGITWRATTAGNQALVAALERAGSARPATPIRACFEPACRPPYRYAQYVIPLQQSMDIPHTVPWATRRWPGVRLNVSYDRACDPAMRDTVPMPCGLIADHGRW